jgi:uncharacterized Zn-binding protein involved in type VI secretion
MRRHNAPVNGKPAAKMGDKIVAIDTHVVLIPSPAGPIPTMVPAPFNGVLSAELSKDVQIMNMPAATKGSVAMNTQPHVPAGGPFQKPPSNQGSVELGSTTVLINGRAAARHGDVAKTCNDPQDAPIGNVIAVGTVLVGG